MKLPNINIEWKTPATVIIRLAKIAGVMYFTTWFIPLWEWTFTPDGGIGWVGLGILAVVLGVISSVNDTV